MEVNRSAQSSALLAEEVNPALQTANSKATEIVYKARLMKSTWSTLCPTWDYQEDRHYFHVLENGYEKNDPVVMPTFLKYTSACCMLFCCGCDTCIVWCFSKGLCTCVPRNNCCNGVDVISKSYFDRGHFDRQGSALDGWCGSEPILSGSPKIFAGSSQYVCCCIDCPEMGNQCMECYFPDCCGGRVFVQPFQSVMGVEMVSCWLCNFFSLCGLKDGEPLCLLELTRCLEKNDEAPLRSQLESAYGSWFSRVYAKKENK